MSHRGPDSRGMRGHQYQRPDSAAERAYAGTKACHSKSKDQGATADPRPPGTKHEQLQRSVASHSRRGEEAPPHQHGAVAQQEPAAQTSPQEAPRAPDSAVSAAGRPRSSPHRSVGEADSVGEPLSAVSAPVARSQRAHWSSQSLRGPCGLCAPTGPQKGDPQQTH
ncbi:hypothetical protein NDU88_001576 [Pleurodeles waltl]|uniref:Uncharacterized protein n=1 Tax=Pleurodeles waltl TaxID=8319 RepID=A0AAV7UWG6_PLEWA|nr:hypothetical protein NDU88_001576 [Pleurodeles waltl]